MGRYRDQTLGIRLTQDEKEKILAHMEKAGFRNITDFFIYCTYNCRAFNFDLTPLLAVKNEMSRIGSNINQIAKVANTSKSIYRNDVLRLENTQIRMFNLMGEYGIKTPEELDEKIAEIEKQEKQYADSIKSVEALIESNKDKIKAVREYNRTKPY